MDVINIVGRSLGFIVILISVYEFFFVGGVNGIAISAILFCLGVSTISFSIERAFYKKLSATSLKAAFYISLLLAMKYLIFG